MFALHWENARGVDAAPVGTEPGIPANRGAGRLLAGTGLVRQRHLWRCLPRRARRRGGRGDARPETGPARAGPALRSRGGAPFTDLSPERAAPSRPRVLASLLRSFSVSGDGLGGRRAAV